jgi:hypothetical protein
MFDHKNCANVKVQMDEDFNKSKIAKINKTFRKIAVSNFGARELQFSD